MKLMEIIKLILKYKQDISFSVGIIFAIVGLCEFTSKQTMLKITRLYALIALFLGFYISVVSINVKALINQSQNTKSENFVKQNQSNKSQSPAPFFEPVDEKEIDEDEQTKHNPAFPAQIQSITFSFLSIHCKKEIFLPFSYQQNFAFKAPRIILFHSWKYFLS